MTMHDDVLLTGLSLDGERLLVVPVANLMAELPCYRTLLDATTFAQARHNPDAADMVAAGVESYLERLAERGPVTRTWTS